MAIALPIIAAVGTGAAIYGQVTGAKAQADAMEKNAQLKGEQADEMLYRENVNETILRERGDRVASEYVSAQAASGGAGGGIGGALRIKQDTEHTISLANRDANFKAKMLRSGAEMDRTLASDTMTAGYLSSAGTLLTGFGQVFKDYSKSGSTPSLPKVGGP